MLKLTQRVASKDAADIIMFVTNEAFMADAFFKKPEYYQRFESISTVEKMIDTPNSIFICMRTLDDIVGSIYVQWDIHTQRKSSIVGHFSCVSVSKRFEKKGIGRRLVAAAEEHIKQVALALPIPSTTEGAVCGGGTVCEVCEVSMECGVINLRTDLFPWYQAQGYEVVANQGEPSVQESAEVDMIKVCDIMKHYPHYAHYTHYTHYTPRYTPKYTIGWPNHKRMKHRMPSL